MSNPTISCSLMQRWLEYSLPRNPTVNASISVVTTYYVGISNVAMVSVFIFVETELQVVLYSLHRKQSAYVRVVLLYRSRCLAMDCRSDSDIPAFRPHATLS
jgi:hypothetical protein